MKWLSYTYIVSECNIKRIIDKTMDNIVISVRSPLSIQSWGRVDSSTRPVMIYVMTGCSPTQIKEYHQKSLFDLNKAWNETELFEIPLQKIFLDKIKKSIADKQRVNYVDVSENKYIINGSVVNLPDGQEINLKEYVTNEVFSMCLEKIMNLCHTWEWYFDQRKKYIDQLNKEHSDKITINDNGDRYLLAGSKKSCQMPDIPILTGRKEPETIAKPKWIEHKDIFEKGIERRIFLTLRKISLLDDIYKTSLYPKDKEGDLKKDVMKKTVYIPVSIDIETTGLDTNKNEIIQISNVTYDKQSKKPLENKFTSYLLPDNKDEIDPNAIERNKINIDEIPSDRSQERVRSEYLQWIKSLSDKRDTQVKLDILGHNYSGFDVGFMKAWIGPKLYNDTHHYRITDTVYIARYLKEIGAINPKTCSLEHVCEYFDIEIPGHDAERDAIATILVYQKLMDKRILIKAIEQMPFWEILKIIVYLPFKKIKSRFLSDKRIK